MNKNVIGIDPGKSGSIVIIRPTGSVQMFKMPETPKDTFNLLKALSKNSVCFLERIWGMPGMGGTAMFTFGKGYGWLEMALIVNKIQVESVLPQTWIKTYGIGSKGKQTTAVWKNKLKAKAQQIFPDKTITLQFADALLIAEYGRRYYKQNMM